MACSDQISTEDLLNAKLDATTLGEVATSRVGAESGGAPITESTNRFNETTDTIQGRLNKLGVIVDDPIKDWSASLLVSDLRAHRYPATTGDVYVPIKPLPFTTGLTFNSADWALWNGYADIQIENVLINDLSQAYEFDALDDAINNSAMINGKVAHIKNSENSDGYDVWDIVLTSTVTSNPVDIITSVAVPLLSFVKRDVKPTVTFTFDGAYASFISTVVPLFKSKGLTCGTAIITVLMESPGTRYSNSGDLLQAQSEGFEMLNRNLSAEPLLNTDEGTEFAKSQINGAFDLNTRYGFNIKGYVSGNSFLEPTYLPIAKEKHANAYTVNKQADFGQAALQVKPIDLFGLHRTNLFSVGLANAKATVNAAIASNGIVSFTDHDPLNEVGNPPSMNTADLTELLDYILAKGAAIQVLNPTEGLGEVGRESYRNNRKSIEKSDREQTSLISNQNLLRDPWFKTLSNAFSGWFHQSQSGDAAFSMVPQRQSIFGNSIAMLMDNAGTVVDGTYIFYSDAQRRQAGIVPNFTNLTFSAEPYLTDIAVDDNFELTIGLQQFKTSDNSLMASSESTQLTLDTRARKYQVTLQPVDVAIESYFRVFFRATEKVIGVGGVIILANPKLEYGSQGSVYTDDAPTNISDLQAANGLLDIEVTNVPFGVWTKFDIEDIDRSFWSMTDGDLLCRETGFYTWDLQVTSVALPAFTDQRSLVALHVNGVTDGKNASRYQSGETMIFKHSGTMFVESGTVLSWHGIHALATFNTENTERSFFRLCKIG